MSSSRGYVIRVDAPQSFVVPRPSLDIFDLKLGDDNVKRYLNDKPGLVRLETRKSSVGSSSASAVHIFI